MSKVTMRQIAAKAGVSVMTVSRALKDNPRLSAATRKRVQRIARDLGYVPHPYVTALMSGLRRTQEQAPKVNLAILHFGQHDSLRAHSFYKGVCQRAHATGYAVEAFTCHTPGVSSARLREILLSRGIRGIILMPAPDGFASLDFNFEGFATAALGHTISHPPLPRVANDIYSSTFVALDKLRERGYHRIGLVITAYVNRLARFLYSASILAYRAYIDPQLHLVEHVITEPAGEALAMDNLALWIRAQKLDAVICPVFGLPIYERLQDAGFSIPRQLAYVHLLDHSNPEVTTMRQMGEAVGGKAVDLVVAMINRNEFTQSAHPPVIAIQNQWHEGCTAPPRKPRPS
jgi:LacI family transcriptional regulator